MKDLFKKEIAIFNLIKSIRLKDINIGGVILAVILMVLNIILDDYFSFRPNTFLSMMFSLILLLGIYKVFHKRLVQGELQRFTCIQILVMFLYFLIEFLFPTSIIFIKVLLSAYLILNYFIFILGNLAPVPEVENEEI